MAKVFVGDKSRVDPVVLEAVQTLPDDYWVLAEFTLRRNFDWFVVRPFEDSPAVLIVTELKRQALPLRGSMNAPWEEKTEGDEWQVIEPSHSHDKNFYWQAVNAANSLSEWLRNNEPVYNNGRTGTWTRARIWPDLLIVSPPAVRHQLPLRPDTGFGYWFYDVGRWLDHLRNWKPNVGPLLTEADVALLVEHLGLTPLNGGARVALDTAAASVERPDTHALRLDQMEQAVQQMDARLRRIEGTLESMARVLSAPNFERRQRVSVRPRNALTRALDEDEREAIVAAVRAAAEKGYVPSFPTILLEFSRILGEDLKASSYRGFGTARALFDQAVREDIVEYGPPSGPAPTLLLPGVSRPNGTHDVGGNEERSYDDSDEDQAEGEAEPVGTGMHEDKERVAF